MFYGTSGALCPTGRVVLRDALCPTGRVALRDALCPTGRVALRGALCPTGRVALRGALMIESTCLGCNLNKLRENSSEAECLGREFQ